MSHGPQTFKKRDVTRAVQAVKAAGEKVQRVEVDKDGRIIVIVGEADQTTVVTTGDVNEWDRI
jgi:hypothetical protein